MQEENGSFLSVARLFQRHLMRVTEQVYDKYYKNTGYSFWLLALQIHDFGKFCESIGIDTIDLQERAIIALYQPHLNAHSIPTLQYVLAMLRNINSSPEGRVRAVEKMMENEN